VKSADNAENPNNPVKATEGRFKSKLDAVDLGQFLAMREEVSELRIRKVDGSIQSEFVFGRDPHEVEG